MRGEKFMRTPEQGGKRKVACYPTLAESVHASEVLLRKALPDLRSQEITGGEGEPLLPAAEPVSQREIARRLLLLFTRGAEEADEIAGASGHDYGRNSR